MEGTYARGYVTAGSLYSPPSPDLGSREAPGSRRAGKGQSGSEAQVQDPGPISRLEAKAPSEWSILAFWCPVAPKSIGRPDGPGKPQAGTLRGDSPSLGSVRSCDSTLLARNAASVLPPQHSNVPGFWDQASSRGFSAAWTRDLPPTTDGLLCALNKGLAVSALRCSVCSSLEVWGSGG